MKAAKLLTAVVLLVIVVGVAVPAATASRADAIARYMASHRAPGDAMDRWLANHSAGQSVRRAPVSDLENSLQVERQAVAAQPAPTSDVASSLQVARDAAAVAAASVSPGGGFAWHDAGIGAGVALLLVVLGLSSVTLLRRHRHVAAS